MSAQSSSMHKIIGSVRSPFDRMAGTSRSLVAAARLHPAGFAVPSAVIAVAVAFVTFVTAVVLRVVPPNLFGSGSPPFIQPSTSQARHRPPQQPVLAGPPIMGPWSGNRGHGSTGSHEQGPRSDGAGAYPLALSTTPTLPITSAPGLTSGHNPASCSPAATPTIVSATVGTSGAVTPATPVVRTVAATAGQVVQGVTGVIGAVSGTVGAVTGTVGAVTNTVGVTASAAESAVSVGTPAVSLSVSVPGLG
jgi:hypothetical protein